MALRNDDPFLVWLEEEIERLKLIESTDQELYERVRDQYLKLRRDDAVQYKKVGKNWAAW
jgi:hypothetical protein